MLYCSKRLPRWAMATSALQPPITGSQNQSIALETLYAPVDSISRVWLPLESLDRMATHRLLQRLSGYAHPTGTAILKLGASAKTTVAFTHPITI